MYNAAVWLRTVEDQLGEQLDVTWRSFPLEQVNSQDEDWVFWEQSVDDVRGLRAFLAAEAVRNQGEAAFRAFMLALLRAVHERKMPVHELDTIKGAADQTPNLDVDRMLQDMKRSDLRDRIARDYREGVDEFGVFGTPTFRFEGGDPVFVKATIPPQEDALSFFESLRSFSAHRPYVRELKKPRRPESSR